jgi:hypothetical protein
MTMDFAKDPLTNIVYPGIKEPIRLLVEKNYLFAALAMTYSGIDAMAYLRIPASQQEVKPSDFQAWCDQYLNLSCPDQPNGIEWWGARCGVLHTHSGTSRKSRSGGARVIHYADRCEPPVMYRPEKSEEIVVISIHHLVSAFLDGIDEFLVYLFADPESAKIAENRLQNMLVVGRFDDENADT